MKADAVFEGGGMRGIGIVGALSYLETQGYKWQRLAGTSVGSVIASLLAAGYSAHELKEIVAAMNFKDFMDKEGLQRIPILGKALGFFMEKGIYSGDYVEQWIDKLLKYKGVSKFKDLQFEGESRIKIIASDITRRKIMILPDCLKEYGLNPMEFSVAKAVRMSISIPMYFKPVEFIHADGISYVMDGALCDNFPINIFDVEGIPRWPTIGFKFDVPEVSNTRCGKTDPVSILCDIADTIAYEKRNQWMKEENICRSVLIQSEDVRPTEFNISKAKSISLFKAGYKSAVNFHKQWSFEEYLNKYRTEKNLEETFLEARG